MRRFPSELLGVNDSGEKEPKKMGKIINCQPGTQAEFVKEKIGE